MTWKIHSIPLTLNLDTIPITPDHYRLSNMKCMPPPASPCTYAIGDLHGNMLKLFAFLLRTGLIDKPTTEIITSIQHAYYEKNYTLFKTQIDRLQFNKQNITKITLILLGDTLCDRGNSDYMTLLLYELMANNGVNFTIILSNHDLAFIRQMEQYPIPIPQQFELKPTCSYDINTIEKLEQIKDIYKNIYKPRLRIAVTDIENNIIYSHAPCNSQAVNNLGANAKFDSLIKQYCDNCFSSDYSVPNFTTLGAFVWNRDTNKYCDCLNVFGHIGETTDDGEYHKLWPNQINLDTDLGRHVEYKKSGYIPPGAWECEPDTTMTVDGELKILKVIHNSVAA